MEEYTTCHSLSLSLSRGPKCWPWTEHKDRSWAECCELGEATTRNILPIVCNNVLPPYVARFLWLVDLYGHITWRFIKMKMKKETKLTHADHWKADRNQPNSSSSAKNKQKRTSANSTTMMLYKRKMRGANLKQKNPPERYKRKGRSS